MGVNNFCMGNFRQIYRMQQAFSGRIALKVCDFSPLGIEAYYQELFSGLQRRGTVVGSSGIGQAFTAGAILLVGALVLGSSAARVGAKATWGVIATVVTLAIEAALLVPFVSLQANGPLANGMRFGIGVFLVVTFADELRPEKLGGCLQL